MALPTHPFLETQQEGQLLWITFNRPEKMNALLDDMLDALVGVFNAVENDDSVSVVIVRGKGRCFSSGYDIGPATEGARPNFAEGSRRFFRRRYAFIDRVWTFPKPVIACVHGYCLAGASDFANACDLTMASEDAVFGYPAVRWGGHTHRVTYAWHLPLKKAKELLFTGDRMTAAEAMHYGMVNRVVPLEQLEAETRSLALRIAMIPISGLVVNKTSVNYAFDVSGYSQSMQYSFQIAETNLWRENSFFDKVKSEGLNSALSWRDDKFEDKK
jgi:enoyl-CoA hydratase/carnithine racemase